MTHFTVGKQLNADIFYCVVTVDIIIYRKSTKYRVGLLQCIGLQYKNDELFNSVLSLMVRNIVNCPLY